MKSPRTTLMREWLIRTCWGLDYTRCPVRTLRALHNGGWVVVVLPSGLVKATDRGRAWIDAFLRGEPIGGAR